MRVLILGVGNAQVDLIEACARRQDETIGCSYREEGPGLPLVDRFELVDLLDPEGLVACAKKHQVELVYSVGSDIAMPRVAQVSETLGLPTFVSSEAAHCCQNKGRWRAALGELFPGNVAFQLGSTPQAFSRWDRFPAMVKPVDSQGQRGVYRVDSPAQLTTRLPEALTHSRRREVIVEEFISGPEFSVNGYLVEGRLVFFAPSDRLIYDAYPGGIVRGHRIPSTTLKSAATRATVRLIVEKAAQKLDLQNGPLYLQLKLDHRGEPRIIEITPRLDGCHMWQLLSLSSGVDLLQASLDHLAGSLPTFPREETLRFRPYETTFFSQPPHTLFTLPDQEPGEAAQGVVERFYYRQNELVRPINGHFEKVGYRIAPGEGEEC